MSVGPVGNTPYDAQAYRSQRSTSARINSDPKSIRQHPTDASTGSASGATDNSRRSATGSLSTDLQSFFNDLKQTGDARRAHHHSSAGGPKPSDAGADAAGASTGANLQSTSQGDLLGQVVKAFQAYSSQSPAVALGTIP